MDKNKDKRNFLDEEKEIEKLLTAFSIPISPKIYLNIVSANVLKLGTNAYETPIIKIDATDVIAHFLYFLGFNSFNLVFNLSSNSSGILIFSLSNSLNNFSIP